MVKEYQYINIREVLSRLNDHPLLSGLSLERIIRYTIDFIAKMGMPKLYQNKQAVIPIEEWKGLLPCDLISIIQVKDTGNGICLRSMTDSFNPTDDFNKCGEHYGELTFKTQGRIIYTSFKTGEVELAYKAIPVDEDGFPLLIDNPVFLEALELFIKMKVFTNLFDEGKINGQVLQNVKQDYAWAAGQCQSEFTIPSISEMQSITNMWTTLIHRTKDFYGGFKDEGKLELLKLH